MRASRLAWSTTMVLLAGASSTARAQRTATQTVAFQVNAVSEISVSGNPPLLSVNTATAGYAPASATVAGTSYAVTTNEAGKKIVAALDRAMPPYVDLAIALAAPAGATSAGTVTLSTSGVDAVVGLGQVSQAGMTITYTLTAAPQAGTVPQDTRTVTLTIVNGA